MDNEMIERVAERIYDRSSDSDMLADYSLPMADARLLAIAAIKAMREPTEKMISRSIDIGGELGWGCFYSNYVNAYKSMIDSIIND